MTRRELERLQALTKRRDWLAARVERAKSDGKDLSYDNQERAALDWAIGIIAEHSGTNERGTDMEVTREEVVDLLGTLDLALDEMLITCAKTDMDPGVLASPKFNEAIAKAKALRAKLKAPADRVDLECLPPYRGYRGGQ